MFKAIGRWICKYLDKHLYTHTHSGYTAHVTGICSRCGKKVARSWEGGWTQHLHPNGKPDYMPLGDQ